MIVSLPVCAKDEHLAIQNLEWCIKLDNTSELPCVISHDKGFVPTLVGGLARCYFKELSYFYYDQWKGEQEWPFPQNWAWQSTARHLAKQTQSWLWWEADAVPLRKGWLQALLQAKEESTKPFMGCVMSEWDGHLNGVAIYPPDVHNYTTNGLICRSKPFDVVMGQDIARHVEHTTLIQHVITPNGSTFPDRKSLDIVNPEAVLFHRCKDGSLIKRLSG